MLIHVLSFRVVKALISEYHSTSGQCSCSKDHLEWHEDLQSNFLVMMSVSFSFDLTKIILVTLVDNVLNHCRIILWEVHFQNLTSATCYKSYPKMSFLLISNTCFFHATMITYWGLFNFSQYTRFIHISKIISNYHMPLGDPMLLKMSLIPQVHCTYYMPF